MRLSHKAIKEFAEIYLKEYGESLTFEEAEFMSRRFLDFVYMVSHPPGKDID